MRARPIVLLVLLTVSAASAAEGEGPASDVLQVVTLADGRTLEGRLNEDRSEITLIDAKTGKPLARMPIASGDIVGVSERAIAAPAPAEADADDAALSPAERERARAEKAATLAATRLAQAKARTARAIKANDALHKKNHGRTISNPEAHKREMAKYPKAEKEIADATQAEQLARTAFTKAVEEYRKLGGTRVFEEGAAAKP